MRPLGAGSFDRPPGFSRRWASSRRELALLGYSDAPKHTFVPPERGGRLKTSPALWWAPGTSSSFCPGVCRDWPAVRRRYRTSEKEYGTNLSGCQADNVSRDHLGGVVVARGRFLPPSSSSRSVARSGWFPPPKGGGKPTRDHCREAQVLWNQQVVGEIQISVTTPFWAPFDHSGKKRRNH